MTLLPCQVCCPLSSAVTLLFSPLLCLAVLAEGSNFKSLMGPSPALQNVSNQVRNVSEMFMGAVKLIPAHLHQPCWKGRWVARLCQGHSCPMGTPSPVSQRPQEPHNLLSGHQIILARGSQCCLGVHVPVHYLPKHTHRVKGGTEKASPLILPWEGLVVPLSQMF